MKELSNPNIFHHMMVKGLSNPSLCEQDLPRFALIGIGDFGEVLIDRCRAKTLYGVDYFYINSKDLVNLEEVEDYDRYREPPAFANGQYSVSFVNSPYSTQSTLNDSLIDVQRVLSDKEYVFVALNIECENSLNIFDCYVEVAKSQNCHVIALAMISVNENDISNKDSSRICESLEHADSIIEIPDYMRLYGDDYLSFDYYKFQTESYVDVIASITQIIHGGSIFTVDRSDYASFFKQSKYIRLIIASIKENDINISSDIKNALDYYYQELENQ